MSDVAIIGFVAVFMLATVVLSVGAAWVGLREETHAPAPLREGDEAGEE